jgi:hypothetical protein
MKKNQEAYNFHKKAADLYLDLKMDLLFADELGYLNPILSLGGYYDEGSKEMDKAIEIYSNHKKLPQLAKSYVNKSIMLVGLRKWDVAFDFLDKASDLYKLIGMEHEIKSIDEFKEMMSKRREEER